jgi:hypothetical protein
MTTLSKTRKPDSLESGSTLRHLTSQITNSFSPVATRNKSVFINDIPDNLYLQADRELVTSVLSGLVSAVVRNAKESRIRLSAKIYSNVVLVHVKDYNSLNHSRVESGLQELQPLAEKMGGSVGVTSQRHNIATYAFSFPNQPMAA